MLAPKRMLCGRAWLQMIPAWWLSGSKNPFTMTDQLNEFRLRQLYTWIPSFFNSAMKVICDLKWVDLFILCIICGRRDVVKKLVVGFFWDRLTKNIVELALRFLEAHPDFETFTKYREDGSENRTYQQLKLFFRGNLATSKPSMTVLRDELMVSISIIKSTEIHLKKAEQCKNLVTFLSQKKSDDNFSAYRNCMELL